MKAALEISALRLKLSDILQRFPLTKGSPLLQGVAQRQWT